MRRLYAFVLLAGAGLLALWGCAGSEPQPAARDNDWVKAELRGRVRRVVARGGEYFSSWQTSELTFNANGYLLQEDYHDEGIDGEERNSTAYTYDAQGLLATTAYRLDGVLQHRTEFEYDAQGRMLVERTQDTLGREMNRCEYTYDAAGRRVLLTYVGATTSSRNEYAYDAAGNNVECRVFEPDGSLAQRVVYAYDGAGRPVGEWVYDSEDVVVRRVERSYDAQGRMAQEVQYGMDEQLVARIAYTYDAYGNMVETQETDAEGAVTRYTRSYEYDAQGNWLRAVSIRYDGGAAEPDTSSVDERTIEYYE